MNLVASIPSPSSNSISLGPLDFRAYGVAIALGVLAAVVITQRRWAARGNDPDDISMIAMWAVPFGVVGGRLYHVVTDNQRFRGQWLEAFKIWEGGLGVWGAIAAGALGAYVAARRANLPIADLFYATAPAIPVAQAVGRLGNWFNQELFGRPTDVPWALEIDADHRPTGFENDALFHPTFLYEALWNLGVAAVVIWVVPKVLPRLKNGYQFAVYVALYTLGRLWIELLRIDAANKILGQRLNVWTSLIVGGVAVALVVRYRNGDREADAASSDLTSANAGDD